MRAVCAGLAFWFAVIAITPTLDITINTPPTVAAWSSR
jgi:hypothetical protein